MLTQDAEGAVKQGDLTYELSNVRMLNELDALNACCRETMGKCMGGFSFAETVS